MSTPPAPPRFRFSLITIIVVVNVAGLLIWANVYPHFSEGRFTAPNGKDLGPTTDEFYGWPVRTLAKQHFEKRKWESSNGSLSFEGEVTFEPVEEEKPKIVWNVVIGLLSPTARVFKPRVGVRSTPFVGHGRGCAGSGCSCR